MNSPATNQPISFYEIYGYYTPAFHHTLFGKCIIALAVLGLLGLIAYVIYRKNHKPLQPWEWALNELSRLNLESCKNKDDLKKFYFALSTIIKKYLHKHYAWQTEDKTDDELVSFLQNHGFDATSLEMIKKLSEGSLWIKFANESVIRTQAEEDLKIALSIIKQTKPAETKHS